MRNIAGSTGPHAIRRVILAALIGGVVAGAIDITYAIVASAAKGVSAARVLQSVASGLFDRAAFEGGAATAALGAALHFAMTIVMAVLFIAAARSLRQVRQNLVVAGLLYGAAIYFAMRWIVVPASNFPGDLRTIRWTELIVHMVGVGLVIALAGRWLGAIPDEPRVASLRRA